MTFIADKQTLDDLNLLGKYKQNSVFSLFNEVKTMGGEKLLSSMFLQPLSAPDKINRRSATFQYFQDMGLDFPFSNEDFSELEMYMSLTYGRNLVSLSLTLSNLKLLFQIAKDERYGIFCSGLKRTISVLKRCRDFLNTLPVNDVKNPYGIELDEVKKIFDEKRLNSILIESDIRELPFIRMIQLDHLLKNKLKPKIDKAVNLFYQLDVFFGVGNLAKKKGFSYARCLDNSHNLLCALQLGHPCIENAVCNDVCLDNDNNLMFLTGANMAGKSTFMKAFGINLYMAHMGFPVSAKEMVFSIKDGIYSSINVSDNLNQGLSHFYAEVLRVKKVAEEVANLKNFIILFDELFKGTNVKDAYDATLAVTGAFANYRNCLFIISTHIIETGEVLAEQNRNIQLRYLPTIMAGNLPTYTYKIKIGISSDKHGMMIIENEKIFELLK